ncbi:MAG: HIT family protein [Betaproteobacteria bacterium]|jgi:histidine triad (HIT) family protein|nr:HIT family protein [Betaproteobacteria bacterium]
MMASCVFCRIVAKEIPAAVVYEDELTIAFMDAGQVNPGHVLVAAKAHAETLYDLDDAQAAALLRGAVRVARAIRNAFQPQGLSVYQANGKAAWQSVFHYHMHLLPRHEGDGMALTWPAKNPPREQLAEYAVAIRQEIR